MRWSSSGARACSLLYVEVGANDGTSLSALAAGTPSIRVAVGLLLLGYGRWHLNELCVYGFEPSRQWTPRLRALERAIVARRSVAQFEVHAAAAVIDDTSSVDLVSADTFGGGVCNSILTGRRLHASRASHGCDVHSSNVTSRVPAVNLVRWLRTKAVGASAASIMLRIDAEGLEYLLLPALAASGLGSMLRAQGRAIIVLVEWHGWFTKQGRALRALSALVNTSMINDDGPNSPDSAGAAAWRQQFMSVGTACLLAGEACNARLAKAGIILHKDAPGASGASSGLLTAAGVERDGQGTEEDLQRGASERRACGREMAEWMRGLLNGSIPPHRWGEVQRRAAAQLMLHYPRVH